MKVLIDTYATAFQNKAGGVHNRILRTADALRSKGVSVDFFDKFKTNVEDYDVLHVFMLSVESYGLIKLAKAKGKKVIISSIVTLSGKCKLLLYRLLWKFPIMTTYKILFDICVMADSIIAETQQEARFLEKYYGVKADKICVIPNGVNEIESGSKRIYAVIGKKCEYALVVGRFDENKNQLNVIKALKNTDVEVIFIGGESSAEKEYYQKCMKEAKESGNIHFLGWVDSEDELLKSAYANAKVLISASYHETFGLSIIEGAISGAIPVISRTLPILDYKAFQDCLTFNPDKPKNLYKQVKTAMSMINNEKFRNDVKKEFSWENIAMRHIELYSEVRQH